MRIFILSFLFFLSLFGETFYVNNTGEFREALKQAELNFEDDTIILQDGTYDTEDDGLGAFTLNDVNYTITIDSTENASLKGDIDFIAKAFIVLDLPSSIDNITLTTTEAILNNNISSTQDHTTDSFVLTADGIVTLDTLNSTSHNVTISNNEPLLNYEVNGSTGINTNESDKYTFESINERIASLEATLGDGFTDENTVAEYISHIVNGSPEKLIPYTTNLKENTYIEVESVLKTKAVNILSLDTKQLTYKKDKWYMVNAYHLLFIDKEVIDYIWEYDSENGSWKLQDHINEDQNSYKKIDEVKHEKAYWIKMNEDFTFEYNHPMML